jgi:predicted enzyme related to lactoylglutathione lyase
LTKYRLQPSPPAKANQNEEMTAVPTSAIASLSMVNLDCQDPPAMAAFYAAVLGWDVTYSEKEYSMVSDGATSIGFGRVDGFTAPSWPDATSTKRYHLDMQVDDLASAEAACRELGAAVPDFQPGAERWRVLTDPAGHPFCLCAKQPSS